MEYIYYIELEHVINELQKANSKQLRSITKENLNILQHYFNKNSIRFPLRMLLICVIEQLSNRARLHFRNCHTVLIDAVKYADMKRVTKVRSFTCTVEVLKH